MAEPLFYASLPVCGDFARAADPAWYRPLPALWQIGNADIVGSTAAKAAGLAKAVNLSGAAVIAGVTNALAGAEIPYVFGGDGASFAVPPELAAPAAQALAAVARWSERDMELPMRFGMAPIEAIRAAGLDVRVGRYAASEHVRYAMFAGGGLRWIEREIKQRRHLLPEAADDAMPDLDGLSCNWEAVPSALGTILTLMIDPAQSHADARFVDLIARLNLLLADPRQVRSPLPEQGPPLRFPPTGLSLLARVRRRPGDWAWVRRAQLAIKALGSYLILTLGLRVGAFDPRRYRRELVANADFRGYDDGLRMTIDCSLAQAERIEALLRAAREQGIARYGLHREREALMTCISPLPSHAEHVHFIDGATGGYTLAAAQLKSGR